MYRYWIFSTLLGVYETTQPRMAKHYVVGTIAYTTGVSGNDWWHVRETKKGINPTWSRLPAEDVPAQYRAMALLLT